MQIRFRWSEEVLQNYWKIALKWKRTYWKLTYCSTLSRRVANFDLINSHCSFKILKDSGLLVVDLLIWNFHQILKFVWLFTDFCTTEGRWSLSLLANLSFSKTRCLNFKSIWSSITLVSQVSQRRIFSELTGHECKTENIWKRLALNFEPRINRILLSIWNSHFGFSDWASNFRG